MSPLALRRGVVTALEGAEHRAPARVTVDVAGAERPALSYAELTGPVEIGDEVLVNVAAVDLALGSGGFDVVHANLTRGLDFAADPGARVMKLGYTSLQHGVRPVEERAGPREGSIADPIAVLALHGQLAPVAWAAAQAAPGARIGFVQTSGGALPGSLSTTVRELRWRGLLAGHVTVGAAVFGGEEEALSVAGALHAGLTALGWDAAVVGPGPGIVGSGTSLGHGGMCALDALHTALALGARTIVVPRMSSGDPRPRHRGLSHHSATVLGLALRPVTVAVPEPDAPDTPGDHERRVGRADLEGYAGSGLSARTMGRDMAADELFFRAALAGGDVLGREIHGV